MADESQIDKPPSSKPQAGDSMTNDEIDQLSDLLGSESGRDNDDTGTFTRKSDDEDTGEFKPVQD